MTNKYACFEMQFNRREFCNWLRILEKIYFALNRHMPALALSYHQSNETRIIQRKKMMKPSQSNLYQTLQSGKYSFLHSLVLLLVIGLPHIASSQTVLWEEDFDRANAEDDWFADQGVWEIGTPTSGPGQAHSGEKLAATVLNGNYSDNLTSRLIRFPSFEVPNSNQNPRLRFWHWYSFSSSDSGSVQVKPEGGEWETVSPIYTTTSSGIWTQPAIDLSAFSGMNVQLGFLFQSLNVSGSVDVSSGWYIDDIEVVTGEQVFTNPEGFENADFWEHWDADFSIWEFGEPTNGVTSAFSGNNVVGTILDGNYTDNRTSRLMSPSFIVPDAGENPRLRFWHVYSFSSSDSGTVQVKPEDGEWETVSPIYTADSSGIWTQPAIDLSAFAGMNIQLGFLFQSLNVSGSVDVSLGWYIDDVEIVTGEQVFTNPEGFENADFWEHWDADFSIWEFGEPTNGVTSAFSGNNVVGTILDGNYTDNRTSRLMSPSFIVPDAGENPRLRFWHVYSFSSSDSGTVQVKPEGGEWETLSPIYTADSSGIWTQPAIDLSAFAGMNIQLGFLFQSLNVSGSVDVSLGWYIDDVEIVTGEQVFTNPEGFENADFWEHWDADFSIWEFGEPTNGVTSAFSGNNVVGTILDGNYTDNRTSRLMSPSFIVPDAGENPRLRFWHVYSFSSSDSGTVQVKPEDGEWETVSPIYTADSSGIWTQPAIDLSAFAGMNIQLGFLFQSLNVSGSVDVSLGWYIDDVEIVTGEQVFTNPEGFENADFWEHWDADFSIWEFGEPTNGVTSAFSGNNVVGTILDGNYTDNRTSRLMSPSFIVPDAGENPRLRFWHVYSFSSSDSGTVQVKPEGGEWETLSPIYTADSSGIWTQPAIDLSAFAGMNIQLGFLFQSLNVSGSVDVSLGWYIDDVEIVTGEQVFTNPEGFENADFWEHWDADFSIWEFGEPTNGVTSAFSGNNVVGTILDGNYTDNRTSRLMSPSFIVPDAGENPRLRFWHWYSFSSSDSGSVQIKPEGGDWETVSPVYSATSSGIWSQPLIELSTFAGMNVQLGFLFQSLNVSGSVDVSTGWYIDEVQVLPLGNRAPTLGEIGPKEIDEESALTFTPMATDTDNPAQTLTFSIDDDSIALGATIDSETGEFNWTPSEDHGPGGFEITVMVTDSGEPAKSDSESIIVTVNEVNKPPVLIAIGDKEVDEETELTFTATATDPDLPANTLTFSLDDGAPAGAVISGSGVFTWTPTEAQGPLTYNLTIRVTDNGKNPDSLSDFETIAVTVKEVNRPPILGFQAGQGVTPLQLFAVIGTELVTIDIDDPGKVTAIGDLKLPPEIDYFHVSSLTYNPSFRTLFGLIYENDFTTHLASFDRATGEVKLLANLGNQVPFEGIAYVQSLDCLVVTKGGPTYDTNTDELVCLGIDGSMSPVIEISPSVDSDNAVYDSTNEKFYTIDPNGVAQFEEINLETGVVTSLGGILDFKGLSFNKNDGSIYAIHFTTDELYRIETTNGLGPITTTPIGTIPVSVDFIGGMAFAPQVGEERFPEPIGNKEVNEEELLSFSATGFDPDIPANKLIFSLDEASIALGAAIDADTGEFNWLPREAQGPGDYSITITVTDDGVPTLFDSEIITISVSEVNKPPVLAEIGGKEVDEETELAFSATVTDPDIPENTLVFSLDDGAPEGAVITEDGNFSWTPSETQGPGDYEITIRVTDDGGSSSNSGSINLDEVDPEDIITIGERTYVRNETKVNAGGIEGNQGGAIAVLTDQKFAIGWHEGGPTDCFARVYSPVGEPLGQPFSLNVVTTGNWSFGPELTATPDGGFVSFWGHSFGSFGHKFSSAFEPVGGEAFFDTVGATWPRLTSLANGDIIVVGDHEFSPFSIIAKRFDSSLNPIGSAFTVNQNSPGQRIFSTAVAGAPNGNFTYVWYNAAGNVIARIYDPSGQEITDEFIVNSSSGGSRSRCRIVYNSRGEMTVLWHGTGSDDVDGIYARRFDSDGVAMGDEWRVNESTEGNQSSASIAVGKDDEMLIHWSTNGSGDSEIEARLYDAEANPIGPVFSVNKFSSGNQSSTWYSGRGNALLDNGLLAFTWAGVGPNDSDGLYLTTFSLVNDNKALSDFETITIKVNEMNKPPVLNVEIGNQAIDEKTELTFTASAVDPDLPENNLTFSLAEGAPEGASITLEGVFKWTPMEIQGPGDYEITILVTDDGQPALSDSEAILITVNEVNEPPVLVEIGNQNIDEEKEWTFTARASDPDLPQNTLVFTLDEGAPDGASITPAGVFTWTPTEAQSPGENVITVRVTDNGNINPPNTNLDVSETIMITVIEVNRPPVLAEIGDRTVNLGSNLSFTASASDPDLPADSLCFTLDAPFLAIGANIDCDTGASNWTPTEEGVFQITVTVTDDGVNQENLSDFETITITVNAEPSLLAVSPGSLDFGEVAVNNSESISGVLTVMLTNTSEEPQSISSVNADNAAFKVEDFQMDVEGNGSVFVEVGFCPVEVGEVNGNLIIETTGGNITVPLRGVGTDGPNRLLIDSVVINEVKIDDTLEIPIMLESNTDLTLLSWNINYSELFEFVEFEINEDRVMMDATFSPDEGSVIVTISDLQGNIAVNSGTGSIGKLILRALSDIQLEVIPVSIIGDIEMVDTNLEPVEAEGGNGEIVIGGCISCIHNLDVDNDGDINFRDVVFLFRKLFGHPILGPRVTFPDGETVENVAFRIDQLQAIGCQEFAPLDVDMDGEVNFRDIVFIFRSLFGHSVLTQGVTLPNGVVVDEVNMRIDCLMDF